MANTIDVVSNEIQLATKSQLRWACRLLLSSDIFILLVDFLSSWTWMIGTTPQNSVVGA
jgi:hypothetical protein